MAKCDQGYICEVCGEPVQGIINSSLYLRYVIGEVAAHQLLSTPERHLLCDAELAQYISDEYFEDKYQSAGLSAGFFAKEHLDPAFVKQREELVSRGYQRLKEVISLKIPVSEYQL